MPLKKQRGKSLMQNDMNRNSEEIDNYSKENYKDFFTYLQKKKTYVFFKLLF